MNELCGEWRGSGKHHAQGAQVVLRHAGVGHEFQNNRRNNIGVCDALVLHGAAESVEVEALHDKSVQTEVDGVVKEVRETCMVSSVALR